MSEEDSQRSNRRRGVAGNSNSLLAGNFGKLPPQAVDLEEAVLGAMMLEKNTIDDAMAHLMDDFFYKDSHKTIFTAMQSLYTKKEPIDILTVVNELKRTDKLDTVGGPFYITQLTNRVGSSANLVFHSMIIKQQWAKREVIRISSIATQKAYEDSQDIFELKNEMDTGLQKLSELLLGNASAMTWGQQLNETVMELETLFNAPVKVSGVTTGSKKLNRHTGGWQSTDLIIIAARPSMGKSARVQNFVKHPCIAGKAVAFFSLEMGYKSVTKRFLSEHSDTFSDKLITGNISNIELENIKKASAELMKMNFTLIDHPAMTPNDIRAKCRTLRKKSGLDLVIIDYLQLMKPNEYVKGQTRDRELAEITGSLKALAKELNIPIIALSQLSRSLEQRINKRPQLSDLRESGSIEQDADVVLALYRPSYYHIYDERDKYEKTYKDYIEEDYNRASELILLKHRNGASSLVIKEHFVGELLRFTTIEDEAYDGNTPPPVKPHRLVQPEIEYTQPSIDWPNEEPPQNDDLPF